MFPASEYRDYISSLGKVLFDYIPHQILENGSRPKMFGYGSGEEMIQIYMDSSNNQIRMYGTAQELEENLKIYRNFPLKHKKFGFDSTELNQTIPAQFYSIKGELFYCKQDYILHLHSSVYKKFRIFNETPSTELVDFMKKHEKQINGCYEFVRYNKENFDRIHELVQFSEKMEDETFAHLFDGPVTCTPFLTCKTLTRSTDNDIELFQNLTKAYPEIFLPYSKKNNKNMTAAVRIFEDGSHRFMIKSELYKAINLVDPKQKQLICDDKEGFLSTIDLYDDFKQFRSQTDNFAFFNCPITRAKHAAVPIVTPTGDHCILAADALLETLRRSISALNIFQKVNKDTWNTVSTYMTGLELMFSFNKKCKYFIKVTVLHKLKKQTDKFWEKYETVPAKPVRDVGNKGFTVDDLKDELKYLGLTEVFPKITDYAEDVYAKVIREKNEEFLKTCDMFDALEHCQLICIFNQFPNLEKILHTQEGCNLIPCSLCRMCPIINRIAPKTVPIKAVNELSGKNRQFVHMIQPLDTTTFTKNIFDYIPYPLLRDLDWSKLQEVLAPGLVLDNEVMILQIFLNNSKNKLRMYGTAQELAENLQIYRDFPLRHKKFCSNFSMTLSSEPVTYRGIRDGVFCCKNDLQLEIFAFLQRINNENSRSSKVDKYINDLQKQLDQYYEFFRYDKKIVDRIYDQIQILLMKNVKMPARDDRFPEIYYAALQKSREDFKKNKLPFHKPENKSELEVIKEIVNLHRNIFLPYWKTDDENLKIVVRIFEDGPERFVMESELIKVDRQKPKVWNYKDLLHTIDLEVALQLFRNRISEIEFIRSPIKRAKHAAVPIVTPESNHCMLAADALLEHLRQLVFVSNIFQKIKPEERNNVSKYMSLLENMLPSMNRKYFVDVFLFNDIRNNADNFWRKYENVPVKSVRDIGKEGFTLDDLKNELKYLGLTDFFTEIANHAEDVYSEVDRVKREDKLRTCDMFDALEMCQVICILNRFPNLKRLLHSQNACHRVPLLQCESCSINSKRLAVDVEEIVMKFYNTSLDVNTENDKESIPEHSQNDGETLPDNVTTTKESIKTLNASEDKKTECEKMKDEESEISSNDSSCCPNCQQFNKVLNETNEELKTLRNKWKAAEEQTIMYQKMVEECHESSNMQKIETDEVIQKAEIVTRQLTEQASDFKKCKEKLDKIVVAETKLKESNKKLTEKNRSLEQEINRLKQKTTADQKASISMKNQLEKEISDHRRINNEITEKNKGLEKELIQLKEKASLDQMRTKKVFEEKTSENERVINELMEKNRKLEQDIIHLHQNVEKDQMESAKQQSYLQKEISENKRINIELQRSNACLSIQNEEHEKTIRAFSEWIAAVPSVPSGSVELKKEDETPSGMRFQLVGFQKIKDSVRKRNPLKKAENMTEKLISLTNRPEIRELADYELMQFEGKFRNYSQTVEMNIQKLKDSGHCKDLSPLPEFPAFSERFMKEYWNEMEKQPSTSSEKPSVTSSEISSELADSECLICTDPMESTENTIKCENCRRRFHSKCATEWFKVKRVCPACSRGLLDPSEYPSLG